MSKRLFLTHKGRHWMSVFLLFSTLLVLAGVCLVAEPNPLLHNIGIGLQLAGSLFITWCAIQLQRLPTSSEYLQTALLVEEGQKVVLKAWADAQVVRLPVSKLKRLARYRVYLLYCLSGLAALYAVADLFGAHFIRQLVINSRHGETLVVPRLVTAMVEGLFAYALWLVWGWW